MPFIVITIGVLILVAAYNQAHGTLARELEQDIPGYFKWAAAIAAILGLGFIPGMKIPSRWLIALVALVVVLTNYRNIFDGFSEFAGSSATPVGQGAAEPTSAYVQSSGASGSPTQAEIAGIATPDAGGGGGVSMAQSGTGAARGGPLASFNPLNPNSYIGLAAGFGGLG
jgi:hypothetical protein